jgi:hypothetical protein
MLFRPDPIKSATSNQPRILHVQSSIPPDHRATLEGRIESGHWYLDAFLRSHRPGQTNASVVNNLTLIDPTKLHPLGQGCNFAIIYDGAQWRSYGALELEGPLAVLATADGQVSLGMRYNRVNFFEEVMVKVRFTPGVVDASECLSPVPEPAEFLCHHPTGNFIVSTMGLKPSPSGESFRFLIGR